ncbi:phospholipid/cholesterol/gamma-HCH transport system substrate-binding protein [Geodermatophilus normandii]|uniref:Phospholipid/cholesterol/gamma-HCH transport system substrate-binding protein n=1 Tax=Geodermatophilus normandii TaxID=1137989 RepID=A0A317QHG4_9ACTN|nr:MlaD family protein [Geodermatophilus normandii]PWW22752.1 phospholipid/cholesterol/gamma-HCH transport system substrate-binding protein [Geodermatophilus normandii]
MITRRIKLQLLAFVSVALLGISYVGFNHVGLDRLLLGSGFDVAADFRDSGGIFVNAEVTYRGVAVGRVSDMRLTDDGVRVTMTIDPDAAPIPADTDAVVANRSAVGEQYVDLRPASADGPFLAEGAVIPQSRTAIPIPVEQLLLDVDGLVTSLDAEDLRIVVDELGRAFAGAGDDLARLLDNGDLLLARAEQSLPQTLRLITDGRTVLQTQAESRSAIEQWAGDLRAVSDTLVEIDPDLRGLVVNAPDAGAALQDLVDNAGPGLGSLVRNLDVLNGVTIPRLDGVEQLLVTYPDVVSGGFSVVRNDGGTLRAHFGLVLNADDPRACTSGYVSTGRTPTPGAVASVDVDSVGCDVVGGADPIPGDGVDESGSNIRGAQNIGGDGGVGSPGPQGQAGALAPVATVVDDVLGGLLGGVPFARTTG